MTEPIAWGNKIPLVACQAVMTMCGRLGLTPSNATTCMNFESGLNPSAKNPASTATGLIQFMSAVALRLGTSCTALSHMSFIQQLVYVEAYFQGFKTHGHDLSQWTLGDTYMAILWPAAIGKGGDYVMFVNDLKKNHDAYDVNQGLDGNKDGKITKAEVCARIYAMRAEGLLPHNVRMI